jgi:hypothetical protein
MGERDAVVRHDVTIGSGLSCAKPGKCAAHPILPRFWARSLHEHVVRIVTSSRSKREFTPATKNPIGKGELSDRQRRRYNCGRAVVPAETYQGTETQSGCWHRRGEQVLTPGLGIVVFRTIRKLVWPHRERLLSLVMLPAFFLATLPHAACICADGHRESSCRIAACKTLTSETSKTACCGCRCCKDRGSHQGRSCCQGKSCQPTNGSSTPGNGLVAKTGCCQPIVEAPAPAAKTSKVELDKHLVLVATIESFSSLAAANEVRPALKGNSFSTPPPLDAVIVFLHLTI